MKKNPSKSLSVRLPLLFVASVIVIILVVIPLAFLHFHNRTIDQYTRMAQGVTQLMVNAVDGDKVDEYIEKNFDLPEYTKTVDYLYTLRDNYPDILYMYVYRFEKDGAHVVIDLDADWWENGQAYEPGYVYEPEEPAILPLLVQTGYLTIKETIRSLQRTTYRLGFPNQEVAGSFSYHFAKSAVGPRSADLDGFQLRMVRSLEAGDARGMLDALKSFFAAIPYDIAVDAEKYWQSLFYSVFLMIGLDIEAEVRTNLGRIDAVVRVPGFVYVFEFKIKGSSSAALAQIKEKRYFERYLSSGARIVLVGAGFSLKTRNLVRPKVETLA